MNARQNIASLLWWSVPSSDNDEAKARTEQMLDAYRDEVLAEQRTTWPSATELQQAAATKRASGTPEDIAVANLLNAIANTLAWLAPYRPHEGGFEMWGAATAVAQLINGTDQPTRAQASADKLRALFAGGCMPAAEYTATRGEPGGDA